MNIDRSYDKRYRVLLTGGRAPVALDLARQLSASGHDVFMAESCPCHLCIRSNAIVKNYTVPKPNENPDAYVLKLEEIIDEENIDWLIPTCEEIFYVARGLQVLSNKCRVFVDSYDKLKRLHSKWDFMTAVTEAGLPHAPATYLLQDKKDVEEILSARGKWVFKRVYSRFSSNVIIVNNENNHIIPKQMTREKILSLLCNDLQSKSDESLWVAQQFISGKSYCSYSVVINGQMTAHAVYPVEFTAGPGACVNFQTVDHPDIYNWVKRFVEFEDFTGQIAFDFIVTDGGDVYPIECNPRTTSGIHLFKEVDCLDQAFFQTHYKGAIQPNVKTKAMLAPAMLSYGLFQIRSLSLAWKWLKLFIQSKEVIFRMRDPLPFFQQFSLLWWSIKLSRQKKVSVMEATTLDIEWNGEKE